MEIQPTALPGIWQPLMSLLLSSAVVMGSPGPSTISATAVGASYGVRRAINYMFGLIAGTIAVLLAVSAGVTALLMSIPHGSNLLQGISIVYILFLAFRIATAPPLEGQSGKTASPAFSGGFLLAVANPKAYIAIGAVFGGTTVVAGNHSVDLMIKTTLLSVMIVIIHAVWLLAGASLSRVLHDPVKSRLINLALAAVLVVMTWVAFMH